MGVEISRFQNVTRSQDIICHYTHVMDLAFVGPSRLDYKGHPSARFTELSVAFPLAELSDVGIPGLQELLTFELRHILKHPGSAWVRHNSSEFGTSVAAVERGLMGG